MGGVTIQVIINVNLKREILDPQGKAIKNAISRFGIGGLEEVRVGKQIILEFKNNLPENLFSKLDNVAETLLSNPVIEEFTIEVNE